MKSLLLVCLSIFVCLTLNSTDISYCSNASDSQTHIIVHENEKRHNELIEEHPENQFNVIDQNNILLSSNSDYLFAKNISITEHHLLNDDTNIISAEVMSIYNEKKKSQTLAVMLDIAPFALGHLYAGKWGRGLIFDATTILITTTMIGSFAGGNSLFDGRITLAALLTVQLWKFLDAAYCVREYNRKLLKDIRNPNNPDLGFKLEFNDNQAKLGVYFKY